MSAGTPKAYRRTLRQPLAVFGILISVGVAASIGGVEGSAALKLSNTINSNFRGAYDLLVRPADASLEIESTNNLVEQDFLGLTGRGGLTLDQLRKMRSFSDVDLAAPVAVVGYVKTSGQGPCIYMDKRPPTDHLFAFTLTATSSDGISRTLVQRQMASAVIPSAGSTEQVATSGGLLTAATQTDGSVNMCFSPLPAIASPVIGVDPLAEMALLGPTSTFLKPLTEITNRAGLTVGTVKDAHIPGDLFPTAESEIAVAAHSPVVARRPLVPIVVSSHRTSPLQLSLNMKVSEQAVKLGPNFARDPLAAIAKAEDQVGLPKEDKGTSTLDATQDLLPFITDKLELPVPGSSEPKVTDSISKNNTSFDAQRAERPSYTMNAPRKGSDAPTFRAQPDGFMSFQNVEQSGGPPLDSSIQANEQSYRRLVDQSTPFKGYSPSDPLDSPFKFAPVGTFDLRTLALPSNPLSYVPLGAYDNPDTSLVADPSGNMIAKPLALNPTLSATGLLTGPPLAITDLAGAQSLRGNAPLDAIRVRVKGVAGFDAASKERLTKAAREIAALGLSVDIVAGSSPQPVDLYLPRYFDRQSGDLGFVSQKWTTLGAAATVKSGLSRQDHALLLLGVGLCALLQLGLQCLRGSARARDTEILLAAGFGRRSVVTWYLGEAAVAAGAVAAVLAFLGVIVRPTGAAVSSWMALLALVVLAEVAATMTAVRSGSRSGVGSGDVRSGQRARVWGRVRGVASYGRRAAIARPGRTAVFALGGVVTSVVAGLSVGVLLASPHRAGPTLLADNAVARLRPYALTLFLLAALAGVALSWIAFSTDQRSRHSEFNALRACGWLRTDVRSTLFYQRLWGWGPVLVLSVGASWLVALGLVPHDVGVTVIAAGVSTVAWLALALFHAQMTLREGES